MGRMRNLEIFIIGIVLLVIGLNLLYFKHEIVIGLPDTKIGLTSNDCPKNNARHTCDEECHHHYDKTLNYTFVAQELRRVFTLKTDRGDHLASQQDFALVLGNQRAKKGFLTIGISSIRRNKLQNGWEYLVKSVQSIVSTTSDEQKKETTLVVFLADFDEDYKTRASAVLYQKFKQYFDSGFMLVVQANRAFYPKMTGLKRNFNDKPDRVTWRSKQNVDFSFLFGFSKNISQYYLMLEDDVECADRFPDAIKAYISQLAQKQKPWVNLDFSELGFIGKLFKSKDIEKLGIYLMLFYQEQPVDWLIRFFKHSMVQRDTYFRKPSLFQHMGTVSSLRGLKNSLKDKFFLKDANAVHNPKAKLLKTTMTIVKPANSLEKLYAEAEIFWALPPKSGDYILIEFETPLKLGGVYVQTARDPKNKVDYLHNGILEASQLYEDGKCSKFVQIVTVSYKRRHFLAVNLLTNQKVDFFTKCIKLTVTSTQNNWLAIRQFSVIGVPYR